MKVILTERVKGIGDSGDVVEVAPGHARNLLFPRHLAVEATPANLARREAERTRVAKEEARERQQAQQAAARLEGQLVTVVAKAGASGRLFGSVTAQDVRDAIVGQHGIEVDRRRIDMPEPFKALGDHRVALRLYADTIAHINVRIESA